MSLHRAVDPDYEPGDNARMRLLLAALLSVSSVLLAHPGHGSTVVTGTLTAVAADAVSIDVRDLASLTMRRVRILVNEETKYRLGKEPLDSPRSFIGAQVVAAVNFEEDVKGDNIYLATEIRITPPKKKR